MQKIKDRTGEQKILKCGSLVTIKKYYTAKNITIIYDDNTIIENVSYINFKLGRLKNFNKPNLFGVGFFGYGIYSYNSKTEKIYNVWRKMLERCYSLYAKNRRTYKDCVVCDEWHNFQNFAKWFEENYIDGFELDKDIILKGNKIYSPETCCFVPQEINKILTLNNINRGKCLIGVSKKGNKYVAQVNINGTPKDLGHFLTEKQAFEVYKINKEKILKNIAKKYVGVISEKCYNSLICWQIEIND